MATNWVSRGRQAVFIAALGLILGAGAPAQAQSINFTSKTSDETLASAVPATVTFNVVGSQLHVTIDNDSAYRVVDLYFNSDATLTNLTYVSGLPAGFSVTDTGSGAAQTQGTPFGSFNWKLTFDGPPGPPGLPANTLTTVVFNMTGTTTVPTILSKQSTGAPPGNGSALAVIKFQAGPGDDSTFAAANTSSPVVPDGPAGILLVSGLMPLLGVLRKTRRWKES
jgi:hypothetical protein